MKNKHGGKKEKDMSKPEQRSSYPHLFHCEAPNGHVQQVVVAFLALHARYLGVSARFITTLVDLILLGFLLGLLLRLLRGDDIEIFGQQFCDNLILGAARDDQTPVHELLDETDLRMHDLHV